jgi:hypothetical protein
MVGVNSSPVVLTAAVLEGSQETLSKDHHGFYFKTLNYMTPCDTDNQIIFSLRAENFYYAENDAWTLYDYVCSQVSEKNLSIKVESKKK